VDQDKEGMITKEMNTKKMMQEHLKRTSAEEKDSWASTQRKF
jgi:hypothetical protein